MAQVLFQPAGNPGSRDHYRDTVEHPVSFEKLSRFLDEETMTLLRKEVNGDAVATWGVTPGRTGANEKKWDRIGVGDVAVFLRDGRAYSSGVVKLKTRNGPLAKDLWGNDNNGQTWECMYFLKDLKPCALSYEELNQAARYAAANPFQGFIILGEDRAPAVLKLLGRESAAQSVWWVNQGTTYRQEHAGGYVWAPTTDRRGSALAHHASVMRLKPGDAVIHYADGRIRAVSNVLTRPTEARRPAELPEGPWQSSGYLCQLEYRDVPDAIPITAIPDQWRQEEAARSAPQPHPFTRDGAVALGYLYELSTDFVAKLRQRFPTLLSEGPMDNEGATALICTEFASALSEAGLVYSNADVLRFVAALLTKPFVILSGLSGSGKTKLAQALGYWLGRGPEGLSAAVVAVGPDWTGIDSALGYPNALDRSQYATTEVLRCILDARDNPETPHVLVLDEMNLSHVERYFADILSAMESGEEITLYSDEENRGAVPQRFRWPENVYVVGTVNVDETTYVFSPKVLDRANVIEFRVDLDRLGESEVARKVDVSRIEGKGARFAALFSHRDRIPGLPPSVSARVRAELKLFYDVLEGQGHEFGYRTASEVLGFVATYRALAGGHWTLEDSMDAQVVQKLLPRLHGSRRSISGVLISMAVLCSEPRQWVNGSDLANAAIIKGKAEDSASLADDLSDAANRFSGLLGQGPYKLSLEKIIRMLRRLDRNGYVSFAEA